MRGGISVRNAQVYLLNSLNCKCLGASMTLVGLVPPLCDNGNMLVDGGYSAYSSLSVLYTSVLTLSM